MALTNHQIITGLSDHLNERIVGQPRLIERLILALLCDGHLLVEGAPGLAKTKAVKALSECIEADYHRIQFTPDLLPADLTGTDIYLAKEAKFVFQKGPVFHNLLLADEINRAPAKVQSALLEAMAERQVTIGGNTHALPQLFIVMATQNPIEQEGTYPLPEAQLDRFLMYVEINYPAPEKEQSILKLAREEILNPDSRGTNTFEKIPQALIFTVQKEIFSSVHLSTAMENYLIEIIQATREPVRYHDDLARWIRYGASPRGTIALERVARAHAWLNQRDYVLPEDIQAVVHDVLNHRILLNFEAQADNITAHAIIDKIIELVAIP